MDDLPRLIEFFLSRAKTEMDRPDLTGLSQDALESLASHSWPGNVRELQSVVRQALLNCVGTVITSDCLPESLLFPVTSTLSNSIGTLPNSATSSPDILEIQQETKFSLDRLIQDRFNAGSNNIYAEVISEVERLLLTKILNLTDGNQSRASEVLGITRGKIRDRIASFGIKLDTTVSVEDSN